MSRRHTIFHMVKCGFTPEEIAVLFDATPEQIIYLAIEFANEFGQSVKKELLNYLH